MAFNMEPQDNMSMASIATLFECEASAWRAFTLFEELPDWESREAVVQQLHALGNNSNALHHYMSCYRSALEGVIADSFYEESPSFWAEQYTRTGEINVRFLDPAALPKLAAYAESIEHRGKHHHGKPRTCYPPAEVAMHYADGDPRKALFTDVNMTAVGAGHMTAAATDARSSRYQDDPCQWIYHSPHLREFLREATCSESLHPYLNDLGVCVNIMRPSSEARAFFNTQSASNSDGKTALGFHFDSIDSSEQGTASSVDCASPPRHQPRGVTGVIGIQDCAVGGERIVWTSINRSRVDAVREVVQEFDPMAPAAPIGPDTPHVFTEPTAGFLYLFDGGDVLHGVSQVREGVRIASVFLFQKDFAPLNSAEGDEASKYFYGDTDVTQSIPTLH
jgi:hypothetical protein